MSFLRVFNLVNIAKLFPKQNYNRAFCASIGQEIVVESSSTSSSTNDVILQKLKTVTDAQDLYDIISGKEKELNHNHILLALRTLYNLQKSGLTQLHQYEILNHPEFKSLCRSLKWKCRSIDLKETIESLKFLSYLGVPTDSEITVILLNLIRKNINDIELNQIVFLDFLLYKFKSTPLIEALRIALPIIFQINLSVKINHDNIQELVDYLSFVAKHKIDDKSVMNIVSALTLHGDDFTLQNSLTIIKSLCDIKNFNVSYSRLLQNAFNSLFKSFNQISFDSLDFTLSKITDKLITNNPQFYNEIFFNKCIDFVIKNNLGFLKGIYLLKKFNKISYIDLKLLDYLAENVNENPSLIFNASPNVLFTFVSSFSNANYLTNPHWDNIKNYIFQNKLLHSGKIEFPWMKFALEMISLNCFNEKFIEWIFNSEFLKEHLDREYNTLDYIQLLSVYQAVVLLYPNYKGILPDEEFLNRAKDIVYDKEDFPLKKYLEFAFENDKYLKTKIKTNYGHLIDHMLIFDGETPIQLDDKDFFEEFTYPQHCKPVAVLPLQRNNFALNVARLKGVFELKIRTMEAMNIKTLVIDYQKWNELPDLEKIPFITQEIRYKLHE